MLSRIFISLSLLSCLACGDAANTAEIDASVATPTTDASCGAPLACATWIQDYERELVSKLSGHSPIAEGITLSARFTEAQRKASRDFIVDELTTYGLTVQRHNYGTGTNVFARLPATQDNPAVILMGAHFDSIEISPAAGDDGTGTALVVAAARYFSQLDTRANDILFVLFDEEEDGLIGSSAFAEKMRMEVPELAAAHIFDLISWDEDGDGAVELWSADPGIEALYREVALEQDVPVMSVSFGSSDHASFIGNGFASVGVSEEFVSGDNNPYYHTAEDTYENINFDYLERISRLAFEVASRPQSSL